MIDIVPDMPPHSVQRYKLTIEYDGRGLVGWQHQEGLPSIQVWLEAAIARFCGVYTECVASGRTDAGVHAGGQVVHVDLPPRHTTYAIVHGINHHLREIAAEIQWHCCPISILEAAPVPADFHARFSAKQRGYTYKICNRPGQLTWQRGLMWHVPQPLDVHAMQKAASDLVGTHDFTSFRSQGCQAQSPVKTVDACMITSQEDMVLVTVVARSFLYHQVRNMVGTLVQIGRHKRAVTSIPEMLAAKSRAAAGPMAPADGLYFMFVKY
jgi:tRNA pseudouridine38-40 synthase